ncbi:hypothetical protein RCL_jg27849.t1 [Rhizophagus clarus]|uniref:Uncharacterized protein n=1 Tax=Rhizophagus clarus TaxID=94130 RepID=A0A8H3QKF2_9GLOM|nr:hypothetical protein RCL_jg27849.t1 [Rhizophagus clarus]
MRVKFTNWSELKIWINYIFILTKALKAKNVTNGTWLRIINSDDDGELSDYHDFDDDWHDDELENNLNQISQTVFDVMIENAKNPSAFTNKRPLVYIGNSERTQRYKNSTNKTAAVGIPKLDTFFSTFQSYQSTIKKLTNKLKQLEKDQEQKGFKLALEDVKRLINDKSLVLMDASKTLVIISGFKTYIEQEVFPSMGIERKKIISENIARTWLKHFEWKYHIGKKDVYYDDHERPDVIEYRKYFLNKIFKLKKWMLKLAGLSLHVSDFLTKVDGRLKTEEKEACVIMKPETNRDRWWKTEDLIKQITEKAILIFEELYPSDVSVFVFDNATSHAAYAKDVLIASQINLKPGGIKLILKERELWPQSQLRRICDDCKKYSPVSENCYAVCVLSLQPDFLIQRPLIKEIIENQGHKVIFYPKFHCELNFIKITVPEALNSVLLEQIRRYSCHSWRFIDAYRKGLTGTAALYTVKKYKSHRRISENVINF